MEIGKERPSAKERQNSEWHAELPFPIADMDDEGASITLHQTPLYFN